MRRRALIYAALALAVPLPALALPGHGGPVAPPVEELSVSASLDTCGTAADTIVCKIDASWNQIAGADRYAASVTRADGSVVDFGDVGAGSASFWVPYVGNGTYTVTVSAYGTPPGAEVSHVVARDSSRTGTTRTSREAIDAPGPEAQGSASEGEDPDAPAPDTTPEPDPEEPSCDEPDPQEPPADPALEPQAAEAEGEPLSQEASAALDESAELPESVDCPEPEPEPGPTTG